MLSARPNPNTSSVTGGYENNVFTVSEAERNSPYFNSGQGSGPGIVSSAPIVRDSEDSRQQEKTNQPGANSAASSPPQKVDEADRGIANPPSHAENAIGDVEAYNDYIRTMCNAAQEVRDETKEQDLTCIDCGKTCEKWAQLKRHLGTHSEIRPHKCDQCERAFCDSNKLKRHKLTHTGIKPYQCNICDQRVSRPEHLRRHMFTHVEEKPYRCSACEYAGRRPERVKAHQRKCHMDLTNLTVISLDVKLPEGFSQAGNALNLSSYVKELYEREKKVQKDKKRKEPELPTMVPPQRTPFVLPTLDNSAGSDTAAMSPSPPGIVDSVPPASGPVFPGQISPRIKHPEPEKSPHVKPADPSDERVGAGTVPSSQSNSKSSSQRKSVPMKMQQEPPVRSFEGFGTTDFSSVGIPGFFPPNVNNNQSNPASLSYGHPQAGSHMTSRIPGHMTAATSGHMPPLTSGHMTYGVFMKEDAGSAANAARALLQMADRSVTPSNTQFAQQAPPGAGSVLYRRVDY